MWHISMWRGFWLQQPQITPVLGRLWHSDLYSCHRTKLGPWKSCELAEFQAQINPILQGLFYVNGALQQPYCVKGLCRFFSVYVTLFVFIPQQLSCTGSCRGGSVMKLIVCLLKSIWLSGLPTDRHFPLMLYLHLCQDIFVPRICLGSEIWRWQRL